FAYVTNTISANTVSVIATATNTVVATIPVGVEPSGVAITPAAKPGNKCPLGQGFWKNHPGAWPVTSLTLGRQSYTQAALLALFDTPPRGDASVILAHQLIVHCRVSPLLYSRDSLFFRQWHVLYGWNLLERFI